eukprot:scaffold34397_cov58-Phaeocystis_antarctica.AAC.2
MRTTPLPPPLREICARDGCVPPDSAGAIEYTMRDCDAELVARGKPLHAPPTCTGAFEGGAAVCRLTCDAWLSVLPLPPLPPPA